MQIQQDLQQQVAAAEDQRPEPAGYDFSGITVPQKSTGLYTLSYEQFAVRLVKAIQEQQSIIINQQSKIDQIEIKLAALERIVISQRNY